MHFGAICNTHSNVAVALALVGLAVVVLTGPVAPTFMVADIQGVVSSPIWLWVGITGAVLAGAAGLAMFLIGRRIKAMFKDFWQHLS